MLTVKGVRMNKAKLCCYTILIYMVAHAWVSADVVDGKSLIASINASDHENVNSIAEFYDGYISGVADLTFNINWCPPHEFKRSQLKRIVIKHYQAKTIPPDEISAPAKDLIITALAEAHPCQ